MADDGGVAGRWSAVRLYRDGTRDVLADGLSQQDAADQLGWPVSSAAVLRALLQYAAAHPERWVRVHVVPLIEREVAGGMIWGSKKR